MSVRQRKPHAQGPVVGAILPPTRQQLMAVFDALLAHFGPQHWWPGDTPFEIMVGAVLTQNTNWGNVERAIANLKAADALEPERLLSLAPDELAGLIRPSGYFNVKTVRLRALVQWLVDRFGGNPERMRGEALTAIRPDLLAVKGIGPETADSILLYAAEQPTFVIDAYTRRIGSRLGWCENAVEYEAFRAVFMRALPAEVPLYNEYLALWVALGKFFCRPRPLCTDCPLRRAELCRGHAERNTAPQVRGGRRA